MSTACCNEYYASLLALCALGGSLDCRFGNAADQYSRMAKIIDLLDEIYANGLSCHVNDFWEWTKGHIELRKQGIQQLESAAWMIGSILVLHHEYMPASKPLRGFVSGSIGDDFIAVLENAALAQSDDRCNDYDRIMMAYGRLRYRTNVDRPNPEGPPDKPTMITHTQTPPPPPDSR